MKHEKPDAPNVTVHLFAATIKNLRWLNCVTSAEKKVGGVQRWNMIIHNIRKDIPIPKFRERRECPWPEMEVEESVLIKAEEDDDLENFRQKISGHLLNYKFLADKNFKTTLDRENNGVLVWRTEQGYDFQI